MFTTRPDTLYGVSYLVLAPENSLVKQLTTPSQQHAIQTYINTVASKSDPERTSTGKEKGKTGVATGSYAIHPLTGEKVPIWVADYVLAGYGTGAVMAVPAHDERDFAFAQIYDLPIKQVVYKDQLPEGTTTTRETEIDSLPLTEKGYVYNSQAFNGHSCDDTITAVIDKLISLDRGSAKVTYKLRDWVFSRQRYWGEPIPIYFPVEMLQEGGDPRLDAPHRILFDQPIPVPDSELPLKLPAMTDYHPGDDPQGCLARAKDWRFFQKDGKWFARETNTMPQVCTG